MKRKFNHLYFGILIFSCFQARYLIDSKEWFVDGCFSNIPKNCTNKCLPRKTQNVHR